MARRASSTKSIGRNNAPRVHIEYEVEIGDAREARDLPFVMGVFADLSGNPAQPLPDVAQRSLVSIDAENFDARMKAMAPRLQVTVPNQISGQGNLAVELTFESLEDFTPAGVARKVEPLRKLLEARAQLDQLETSIEGKQQLEEEISRLMGDVAKLGKPNADQKGGEEGRSSD